MHKKKTISKILKLKDNKKQEVEVEVKKAADRVEDEHSKLKQLRKDYSDTMKEFNERNAQGTMDVSNITSYYDFFARIEGRIKEQKKIHMQRVNEFEAVKQALVEAHKDQRMFEILKEKALKEEKKEREVNEQKEADFFTMARKQR